MLVIPKVSTFLYFSALLACSACDSSSSKGSSSADTAAKPPGGVGAQVKSGDKAKKPTAKDVANLTASLPPADKVQAMVNSKKLKPYAGKTGAVRGIVRVTGDPPPAMPKVLAKMDAACTDSRATFGTLFREGKDRALADVLVAVTGYDGFVPAQGTDLDVAGKGCAWDKRTYAMTFGQRVVIRGLDAGPYVPEILGLSMPAQLFVLPTAPPVQLAPRRPGRFKLVDSLRLYNVAELFVLAYSTVDVTELDGSFEIKGIPVGKVKVNAVLPQTGAVALKEITIEAGKTIEIEFELAFDQSAYDKTEKPTPLDELPAPGARK